MNSVQQVPNLMQIYLAAPLNELHKLINLLSNLYIIYMYLYLNG